MYWSLRIKYNISSCKQTRAARHAMLSKQLRKDNRSWCWWLVPECLTRM